MIAPWEEWGKRVLAEIESHERRLDACDARHHDCSTDTKVEIAKLQIKAGVWGILGGVVVTVSAIIFVLLKGGL